MVGALRVDAAPEGGRVVSGEQEHPEPLEGWILTAVLPKDHYWVREREAEWEVFTEDDHGAFS
jgi:hypothetical protein